MGEYEAAFPKEVKIVDPKFLKEYANNHPICEHPGCNKLTHSVHHIKFRSKLRLDTKENVISLCFDHHEPAHGPDSKSIREFYQDLKCSN